MPRNFFRRIEVAFPVEDGVLRDRLIHEMLALSMADNVKSRLLQPDGNYRRLRPGKADSARHSQVEFMNRALNGENLLTKRSEPTSKYPQVKLASRPAALRSAKA